VSKRWVLITIRLGFVIIYLNQSSERNLIVIPVRSERTNFKLKKANKCLFILRTLRKEGYNQTEIDHLFTSLVLPNITYALSVYGASKPELTTVQCFLERCYKRKYISKKIDVHELLEKQDRKTFSKVARLEQHPLRNLFPKY
jgi:hypothetical protein